MAVARRTCCTCRLGVGEEDQEADLAPLPLLEFCHCMSIADKLSQVSKEETSNISEGRLGGFCRDTSGAVVRRG